MLSYCMFVGTMINSIEISVWKITLGYCNLTINTFLMQILSCYIDSQVNSSKLLIIGGKLRLENQLDELLYSFEANMCLG